MVWTAILKLLPVSKSKKLDVDSRDFEQKVKITRRVVSIPYEKQKYRMVLVLGVVTVWTTVIFVNVKKEVDSLFVLNFND